MKPILEQIKHKSQEKAAEMMTQETLISSIQALSSLQFWKSLTFWTPIFHQF